MKQTETENLKGLIMEIDPCVKFDDENENKLVGYAERFGSHIIPLYKGVNAFFTSDVDFIVDMATEFNKTSPIPTTEADGLEKELIGYVLFDDKMALLYDKEAYLSRLAKEFEDNGMEVDEEWGSYYLSALEWYEFNVIGSGSSSFVTPAFLCAH